MESPFTFFRTHQKQVLVFLFLTAMLAFTIGDPLMRLVGGRGSTASERQTLIESNVGSLTREELQNLLQRREIANRFIFNATLKSGVGFQLIRTPEFGDTDSNDVVFTWLLGKEAEQLGITVNRDDVKLYLDQRFGKKLRKDDFDSILASLNIQPLALFDILASELQAKRVRKFYVPPVVASPEQLWHAYQRLHTKQKLEVAAVPVSAFEKSVGEPTEKEINELFEKNKSRFDPKYNPRQPWRGGHYKPGFLQPRKVQLQYVKLNFEKAEAAAVKAKPITDAEIQKYYDEKKSIDRALQETDDSEAGVPKPKLSPVFDDTPSAPPEDGESEEKTPEEAEAKDADGERPTEPAAPNESATKPAEDDNESVPPSPTEPAEESAKTSTETIPEEKPATDEPAPTDGATEPPSEGDSKAPESGSKDPCFVQDDSPAVEQTEEKPAADPVVDQEGAPSNEAGPKVDDPKPATEEPVKDGEESEDAGATDPAVKPEAEVKPEGDTEEMGDDSEETLAAPPDGTEKKPKEIKFKPLNDELKDLIRERIARDRAKAYLRKKSSEISDAMFDAGQKLIRPLDIERSRNATMEELNRRREADQESAVPDAAKELKAIAEKFDAEFGETEPISGVDLLDHPVLGKVREFIPEGVAAGSPQSLARMAFQGEGVYAALVGENIGGDLDESDNRFVVWKVRDIAEHVATLNEPGVKEQVVAAWKRLKAIDVAHKRATELAKKASKTEPLEESLKGEKVSTAEDATEIAVKETTEFSWYRESFAATAMRTQLELGSPVFVEGAGPKFMEHVFDKLGENEVGVVTNDDATIQYIVRVASRRPALRETFKSAPLFGEAVPGMSDSSHYQQIFDVEANEVQLDFRKQLEKKYNLRYRNARTNELESSSEAFEDDADDGDDDSSDE